MARVFHSSRGQATSLLTFVSPASVAEAMAAGRVRSQPEMKFPESAQARLGSIVRDGVDGTVRAQPLFHGSRAHAGEADSHVQERLLQWMKGDGREFMLDRQRLLTRHGYVAPTVSVLDVAETPRGARPRGADGSLPKKRKIS